MVVSDRSGSAVAFNVHQDGDAAGDGNAVAAAIDSLDKAAVISVGEAVEVDIDEGVGLDRLVGDVAVLHIGTRAFVYVGTVAAAIDSVDSGFAGDFNVCVDIESVQRSLAVGSQIIREDAVGDLCHLSRTVVAAVEGALDSAARHEHFVAAIDGGHIAAAIDAAFDGAATHTYRGHSDKGAERIV